MSEQAQAGAYPLGIWTSLYWDLSPEDALRHIAELGWRYIDLSAEHLGELWRTRDQARTTAWRQLAQDLGVTPWQCHLLMDLNLASPDPNERSVMENLLVELLEIAGRLGVRHAVFHPGWRTKGDRGPATVVENAMRDSLTRLASAVRNTGVRLAIENMMGPGFGADPADLRRLAETIDPDIVGICFDSSHANADGRETREAALACGKSLWCLHLSDNDGSGDQHRVPYEGTLDWVGLLDALSQIEFAGPLSFELPSLCNRPLPVRDAALGYVQQVMEFAAAGAECVHELREEPLREYVRQGWFDPRFGYD